MPVNPYDYFTHQVTSPAWHWEIVWYFFFAGIAAGTYITSTIAQLAGSKNDLQGVIRGYLIGFPVILICGILLVTDLDSPTRFLHMLWYPRENIPMFKAHSPMSVGGWVVGLFGAFSFIGFLYALVKMEKIKTPWLVKLTSFFHESAFSKLFLIIGMLCGFYLGTYTGVLANTSQLPGWTASPLLPVLFLASGMSAGMALMLLVTPKKSELNEYKHKLERADKYMVILELVALALFLITLGQWAGKVTTGFYGFLLWVGVVLIGLLLPLLLKWKPNLLGHRTTLVSSLLILVGGYVLRYVVIMGPQSGYFGF
ncbi:NrfD/PsrC family molybdoenzyme membrane anchor subunit [Effusibacillus dendaii]|uniref:Polysulfide reductase n=1 Tax=Effusibacillus dendaii TaxID=2743772 RepID=A0A7I8D8G5_9BACL|nr:NrfD/PsrC family molybdoenzyme membrane anchor subunit [Effusibacillus dendaii]BCJ86375.1 polysulfide reductase [Effusibacillus dendaii]